ncbi:hypothetical protein [Aquimarina sp. I32.4]|uniref:hypothetical protein n=1 Tax=Aquimarina sp. I32.4 TaxID=2053903 RepID=UPI000CDEE6C5|nr:hypothetical protein [Aquimarina sp. I32.4]
MKLKVPSYNLSLDSKDTDSSKKLLDDIIGNSGNKPTTPLENKILEPKCPNKNAAYDLHLDNYLRLTNKEGSEIIIHIISTETSKNIRTAYLKKNSTGSIKNIPKGKYKVHLTYGSHYAEKTNNGICTVYFKNEKASETNKNILDLPPIKTDKGINVPSYNLDITKER